MGQPPGAPPAPPLAEALAAAGSGTPRNPRPAGGLYEALKRQQTLKVQEEVEADEVYWDAEGLQERWQELQRRLAVRGLASFSPCRFPPSPSVLRPQPAACSCSTAAKLLTMLT